jgi:sulfide dehydrogenase [flavocytochrome c] flavoprotein chain
VIDVSLPKSASSANAEGKACAGAVTSLIAGTSPARPTLEGTCYNTVTPGYAFSLSGNYQPRDDIFVEVLGSGFTSPVNASNEVREREAASAQYWFKTITVETFG